VTRTGSKSAWILVALLLAAACGVFVWEPWHGPVVLSLSEGHGIAAGDLPALPLLALAVAIAHAQARGTLTRPSWLTGRRARDAAAIVLGSLLVLVGVDTKSDPGLVPAGGGTFDGGMKHADGSRADPVNRWSHLALTYDGGKLHLYVDGAQVSSRAATGAIRRTTDPLWIGGNHPYGEYFEGVIDEVRIYDRALSRSAVRTEMSTPIPGDGSAPAVGLVGAYSFDAGSGTVAADASGSGNTGRIQGATWTPRGRFGSAVRFDGAGEMVRVPASESLDLSTAMTLSAWVRPTEPQSGWRTVLHRQTDAYFLMAGGGTRPEAGVGTLDNLRLALVITAALLFCAALAGGRRPPVAGRRFWYWPPVLLFLAGSAVDTALAPSVTLVGPTLVAMWCALTAAHKNEAAIMYLSAAAFAGVTIASLVGPGGIDFADEDGGVARSAALGLLLVASGLMSALRGERWAREGM
jgi:hypothetical protein